MSIVYIQPSQHICHKNIQPSQRIFLLCSCSHCCTFFPLIVYWVEYKRIFYLDKGFVFAGAVGKLVVGFQNTFCNSRKSQREFQKFTSWNIFWKFQKFMCQHEHRPMMISNTLAKGIHHVQIMKLEMFCIVGCHLEQ